VADELKQFSESLFVISSSLSLCEFKVNFSKVHTNWSWSESLKKLVSKIKLDAVSFSSSCWLELVSVNTIDVERDPVFWLWSVVEILVNRFMNFIEVFNIAIFWFENENLFFFNKLLLFFLKGSNTKVAQVFFNIHTFPVFVEWDFTCKVCKWHTMSVLGRGGSRSVGINMCIDPNKFSIRIHFFHSCDGADSLRVVTSKDDRIVSFFEGLVCLVSKLSGWSNDMINVFSIVKLLLSESFSFLKVLVNMIHVIFWAWDIDLFVLNWDFAWRVVSHVFEPSLVIQPSWCKLDSVSSLSSSEWISRVP